MDNKQTIETFNHKLLIPEKCLELILTLDICLIDMLDGIGHLNVHNLFVFSVLHLSPLGDLIWKLWDAMMPTLSSHATPNIIIGNL